MSARFARKNGNHRGKLGSLLLKPVARRGKVRQLGFPVRRKGKERGRKRGERNASLLLFFFPTPLDRRVRLLVLHGLFDVRTAVHVFGARVYRILLATLRHLLVDDTRVLLILVVLVAGRDVRLASGADVTRSLLVAATSRCNKQRHDRSRQMCVCGYSIFLSFLPLFFFPLFSMNALRTRDRRSRRLSSAVYLVNESILYGCLSVVRCLLVYPRS